MRGCRGKSERESIDNYQFSQRMTNSGEYADEWAARGVAVGKRMDEHKEKGLCEKCAYFKKRKLSPSSEAEFKRIWGSSSSEIAKDECTGHVDDFYKICPEEKNV